MPAAVPPQIFAPHRRDAVRARLHRRQARSGAARYLFDDIADDVAERIAFLRHSPARTLLLGDAAGAVRAALAGLAGELVDGEVSAGLAPLTIAPELPWSVGGFDLIVSLFALDTANDLPGALIHLRRSLAPGGLALVTMIGAGSLSALRGAMLAADGARPAPRLHPQVDVRAGAQLLQRAGFADPVADSRSLDVRFGTLARLVDDLRDHGLGNALAQGGPPLGRAALGRATAGFMTAGDAAGRVTERFELLTLSGWRR